MADFDKKDAPAAPAAKPVAPAAPVVVKAAPMKARPSLPLPKGASVK